MVNAITISDGGLEMEETKDSKLRGRQYADQFNDPTLVTAYSHRPPYPKAIFEVLHDLVQGSPRNVLDIGCGTGDIARRLAALVDAVDAVDAAPRMLVKARGLPGGDSRKLRWIAGHAEEVNLPRSTYGLVTAGESLHWMNWDLLLPRLRSLLAQNGYLAIVGRYYPEMRWADELKPLVQKYNTNRAYKPYDMIDELSRQRLFEIVGEKTTEPLMFCQSVEDFLESIHSQAGFSRDRMSPEAMRAFDFDTQAVLRQYTLDGMLDFQVVGHVVWGSLETSGDRPRSTTTLPMGFYNAGP